MLINRRTFLLGLLIVLSASGCGNDSQLTGVDHGQKAQHHLDQGNAREAILEIKNALSKDSDNAELRWLAGTIYLAAGENAAAEKELSKAIKLGIQNVDGNLALVRSWIAQGKIDKGIDYFEGLAAESLSDEARILYGELLVAAGRPLEAGKLFREILAATPDSLDAQLGMARIAIGRGDQITAARHIQAVLSQDPSNPFANLLNGELALSKQNIEIATDNFQTAANDPRTRTIAQLGQARVALVKGNVEQAHQVIDEVLSDYPSLPLANYLRGLSFFQQQDFDNARTALEGVIKVLPNHHPTLLLLGKLYLDANQTERANRALTTLVNADPEHLAGRQLLAATKLKLRQPEQALQLIDDTTLESDDPLALTIAGSAHIALGNMSQGTTLLEKASTLQNSPSQLRAHLARLHLASGNLTTAIEEFNQLVESGDQSPQTLLLLAYSQIREGSYDQALTTANKLEQLNQKSMAANLRGAISLSRNQLNAAKEQFELAVGLEPSFGPALLNLGRIALAEKDPVLASKHFSQVYMADKKNTEALLGLAGALLAQKKRAEAIELLTEAADTIRAPRVLVSLAQLLNQGGSPGKALEYAETALQLNPRNPAMAQTVAMIHSGMANHTEAVSALLSIPEENRTDSFNLTIAQSARAASRLSLAEKTLEELIVNSPTFVPAYVNLISLQIDNGTPDKAKLTLEKLPTSTEGYEHIHPTITGDIYRGEGNHQEALKHYREAFSKVQSAKLLRSISTTLITLNRRQEALEELTRWLGVHPEDSASRLLLANQQMIANAMPEAAEQYRQVLARDDNQPLALNNLAWIYLQENNPEALSLAEKIIGLQLNQGELLDTAGWIVFKMGSTTEGLDILAKAHDLRPESAEITYHFVVALESTGNLRKAHKLSTQLVEKHPDYAAKKEIQAILKRN